MRYACNDIFGIDLSMHSLVSLIREILCVSMENVCVQNDDWNQTTAANVKRIFQLDS